MYQGKDEEINHKFSKYTLGARVVLQMTEQDWHKNKIIYFDNYFNSIDLLERLKLEGTLACGTVRRDRKGLPNGMATDESLKRSDFDHRTSNTGITFYKWKDNRIITLASNFHGTETVKIKRKLKDGTITYQMVQRLLRITTNLWGVWIIITSYVNVIVLTYVLRNGGTAYLGDALKLHL
ncbi:hypothetical protein JTB14_027841 [Gonioctena quinquepunctata]|nr:hypothetical protein JTB14_027841 [Gonioctena quinquepunctata]